MLKATIFKYAENKLVRTMELGGEPWFVLRDVCEVLSLSTPAKVAERLDMDEVSQAHITDSMGRPQETTIINESGLYNVILRSDKPEAKPFRKWVTAVVLPSIRKNGGYIAGQEELSPQELMAKALLVAQKTIADREARISNLEAQKQAMQPKQKEILQRAIHAALKSLSSDAQKYLNDTYGDTTGYLETRIEAQINANKRAAAKKDSVQNTVNLG